jgi:hypothetical protein
VKFGADLNAYTSFDETVYMLPIPADKPDNLDKAFQVLEDWAHGLTLNDADIDKERGIVLEELRLGKGAGDRMQTSADAEDLQRLALRRAPADRQGRHAAQLQAGRPAPLLPRLVPARPDGRGGGRRHRSGQGRAADQAPLRQA